jgi:hypothetical protein
MPTIEDLSRRAGEIFRRAAGLSFEDTKLQRLRYHLERLTLAGLTTEDVKDLGVLGGLAFEGLDVTKQAISIKKRADASPLAFAIADIVEQAASDLNGQASPRSLMFGAVLGAYTALGGVSDVSESSAATLGAIGGAIAVATSTAVTDNINRKSWIEYLQTKD